MYRVRTQIFGSKIQDFSKTVLYFSRLKVNKQVVYRDLENTGNQDFFMMHCKFTLTTVQCGHKRIMKLLILWLNVSAMGEIEWNLTTGKKIETSYYFSRLYLYFEDFSQVWKTAGQVSRLSRIQDSVRALVYFQITPPPPWQKEIWRLWEPVNNMAATTITHFISYRTRSGWGHLTKP